MRFILLCMTWNAFKWKKTSQMRFIDNYRNKKILCACISALKSIMLHSKLTSIQHANWFCFVWKSCLWLLVICLLLYIFSVFIYSVCAFHLISRDSKNIEPQGMKNSDHSHHNIDFDCCFSYNFLKALQGYWITQQ